MTTMSEAASPSSTPSENTAGSSTTPRAGSKPTTRKKPRAVSSLPSASHSASCLPQRTKRRLNGGELNGARADQQARERYEDVKAFARNVAQTFVEHPYEDLEMSAVLLELAAQHLRKLIDRQGGRVRRRPQMARCHLHNECRTVDR